MKIWGLLKRLSWPEFLAYDKGPICPLSPPSFRMAYESQIALSSLLRGLLPGHSLLLGGRFLRGHLLHRGLLRSGFLTGCLLYGFLSRRFFRRIDSPLDTFWHRNVSECIPQVTALSLIRPAVHFLGHRSRTRASKSRHRWQAAMGLARDQASVQRLIARPLSRPTDRDVCIR
jgi:hypothetical protein